MLDPLAVAMANNAIRSLPNRRPDDSRHGTSRARKRWTRPAALRRSTAGAFTPAAAR